MCGERRECSDMMVFAQSQMRLWALVQLYNQLQMTFPNNSRNIANLLKYEPLEPLNPQRTKLPVINAPPNFQQPPNSRQRQQIPIDQVFTPEDMNLRQARKRTPQNGDMRSSHRDQQMHVQALKVRLDQIVRYYDERHNNLQSKMVVRLNELQNFVMKEVPKIDNNMLSGDIIAHKQLINQLRKSQQHLNNEINAIKMLNNQRQSAQSIQLLNKEKEKSTVLFMQVVRLGETVEKMADFMNSTSRGSQTKYIEMQNKLSNAQKNLMIMAQRSSSGSEVLNELGDKVMNRLATSETNLLILGKEQIKDKEAIAKLMAQNERVGQDLQLILRNMQADFQSKLQNRVQQTINRLMMEHQERIRSHDEIKKNLDFKERITSEKMMNQKMENKAKYDTMDAIVRGELLKKQESIKSLQRVMEDQFRSFMQELQGEGGKRKEQESSFRGQIKRVQENLRKEYDIYKNHQSQLVQKITDMIKSQIEVRLSTQIDLKNLTSNIAHEIVNDVNNLKEALSTSNKKLSYSIRQAATESAERAGQLSHYVDSEIKKVTEIVTEKYSKMKGVFTKLAMQLRDHLQNTESNRKNVQGRLTAIQQDFDKLKNEVNGQIDQFYVDLQARLKEQKQFVETVVFRKNNDLTVRVSKLEEYTNQYFQLLKAGIQDNKDLLNKKLGGLGENNAANKTEQELKSLRDIISEIKKISEEMRQQNDAQIKQIKKDIDDVQNKGKLNIQQMENKINLKINRNFEKQKELEEQLTELGIKINSLRAESNAPNASISADKLKKMADNMEEVNSRVQGNEKMVEKISNEITVLRTQINNLQTKLK